MASDTYGEGPGAKAVSDARAYDQAMGQTEAKRDQYDFGFIFRGSLEEQGLKAGAWVQGLKDFAREVQLKFAKEIVLGGNGAIPWGHLETIIEAEKAFKRDPRMRALRDALRRESIESFINEIVR